MSIFGIIGENNSIYFFYFLTPYIGTGRHVSMDSGSVASGDARDICAASVATPGGGTTAVCSACSRVRSDSCSLDHGYKVRSRWIFGDSDFQKPNKKITSIHCITEYHCIISKTSNIFISHTICPHQPHSFHCD